MLLSSISATHLVRGRACHSDDLIPWRAGSGNRSVAVVTRGKVWVILGDTEDCLRYVLVPRESVLCRTSMVAHAKR